MMKEKLSTKLVDTEIKQTKHKSDEASAPASAPPGSRVKIEPIRFKEDVINRIKKSDYVFGGQKYLYIPFDVSRDTHQKGLKLKIAKGRVGEKHTKKTFYIQFWFNNKPHRHLCGVFSQSFGVKECNDYLIELHKDHTDPKTGFWIKNPIETARDNKRIVPKEDSSIPQGKTINEVIESYCGADEEEGHRGFLKDIKQGYKTSKSAKNIFRGLAGYSKRQSLVTFEDDESGYCVRKFTPNKHLRVVAPQSWKDLFRKYPPGHGMLTKDREYYNRRKKQTYMIPASKNKSIYDSSLGKSLIEKLTPGDVEAWCKDLTSMEVKKEYVKLFTSLWFWARKRGWLGTNPGLCPITLETVYVKKEIRKESVYTDTAISLDELNVFFDCSEELSHQFPFKAELHQLMAVTGIRKAEALKLKKSFVDFKEGVINLPKGINKQRFKNQIVPITPEVEIVLRNILDMGKRPGLDFYKMKDFPWLFATRRWSAEKYFNKDFRLSIKTRLGGDENYIPALRELMRHRLKDPGLIYAPKVLRKTFVTLSRQQLDGRSDKVKHLSRHKSEEILEASYDKPQRAEIKDWGNKATSVMTFIKRRA
jgi:integrase